MSARKELKTGSWQVLCSTLVTLVVILAIAGGLEAQAADVAVSSAYGEVCKATDLVLATSTQHIAEVIKSYAAAKQPVHIRATHRLYHSTASFPCAAATAGKDDVPADKAKAITVDILMQDMDRLVSFDPAQQTITVQAGMTVTQMLAAAEAEGMQVPLMSVPNYGGLTLGGIVATAATGTGTAGSPSALCDIIMKIQWVNGKGEVHTSPRHSQEGKAICGGLGVTGVITELTLQLQQPGKVKIETRSRVSDRNLPEDISDMLKITSHLTVTWRPDLSLYTANMFSPSSSPDPTNATIYRVDRPTSDAVLLGGALKAWQEDMYNLNPVLNSVMCSMLVPTSSVDIFWAVDPHTKQGLAHGLAAGNDILSSTCQGPEGACTFTTVGMIGAGDIHFTIDKPKLTQWINDVKDIIAKDLHGVSTCGGGLLDHLVKEKSKQQCLPPGYFWLRFGKATEDYVGLNTAPYKDPVHVQLSLFRSRAPGSYPMKNGHVQAIIEQLTLCSYNGRPHFGKNVDRTFTYSKCPLATRYPRWSSWLAAAEQHDPKGLFASPLVSTVLHNGSYTAYPGCGITGGCYCETDEHCLLEGKPAHMGWRCLPSKAFPEFKACRPQLL